MKSYSDIFLSLLDYLRDHDIATAPAAAERIGMKAYKVRHIRAGRSSATKEDVLDLVAAYPELKGPVQGMGVVIENSSEEIKRLKTLLKKLRSQNQERETMLKDLVAENARLANLFAQESVENRKTIQRLLDIINQHTDK